MAVFADFLELKCIDVRLVHLEVDAKWGLWLASILLNSGFRKEYPRLPFSDVRNAFVCAVLRSLVSLCEFQLKKKQAVSYCF